MLNIIVMILISVNIIISLCALTIVTYCVVRENKILRNINQKFEEKCTTISEDVPIYCDDLCAYAVYEFLKSGKK